MKKRKNIKIIFNVFLSFVLILLFYCGDLQVFAAQQNVTFYNRLSNNRVLYAYSSIDDYSTLNKQQQIFANSSANISFNMDYNYKLYVGNNHHKLVVNSITGAELSTDPYNPTYLSPGSFIYILSATNSVDFFYYITFSNATPTPEPTPTPTPAPTPTPLPVDYDDTQFWGRINDMAEGGWSALTSAFNGIFNNTVLRNLVVYVPLFGAIIYLFVYLLFMGSD